MSKSSSLAEISAPSSALRGDRKPLHREAKPRERKNLANRVEAVGKELSALPMKPLLIIEPPQVEPLIVTSVGSGQKTGWPEMRARPSP